MSGLPWVFDDGGRAAAGFKGEAGDCVTRAVAIANQALAGATPPTAEYAAETYRTAYDGLTAKMRLVAARARNPRRRGSTSPRDGVFTTVTRPYLADRGWQWEPTMTIGSGCTVHLAPGELPDNRGPLIVSVSKHVCAVVDGVVRDTHDPSRDGTRCVYGYWWRP